MSRPSTLPFFAGGRHERADHLRHDEEQVAALRTSAEAHLLDLAGAGGAADEGRIARRPLAPDADPNELCFIGFDEAERPLFVDAAPGKTPRRSFLNRSLWASLAAWPRIDAGLFATAHSLVDWHRRHRHCAACGEPTAMRRAGWMRECSACETQHFPRVDPVVIMLAEHDGRILIGRQPHFSANQYSALAGFIEPGEGVEDAVIRELNEEAGIRAHSVEYVASQPWPFPSQLMIACMAKCDDPEITIDENELEHAFWAERADVAAGLERTADAPFLLPPPLAIAHHLIRHWLERPA